MDNRIITTDVTEEDFSLEGNLRPQSLDEYIGQQKTKDTLKIYIEACLTLTMTRRRMPIPSARRQKLRAVSSTDAGLCAR